MPVIDTSEFDKLNDAHRIPVYNGLDALMTLEILNHLQELPEARNSLIYDFERGLQGPVLEMMLRGFRVNISAREKAIYATKGRMKALNEIIQKFSNAMAGCDVNPNSGPQLKNVLYNEFKIKPISMWKDGETKFPMDRKILEKIEIRDNWSRPFIGAVLAWKDLAKQLQLLETEIDDDWRFRSTYNITGTTTGRFSSSKSSTGSGSNSQNINPELRYIFTADEGYDLYGYDLEQAESREMGLLMGMLFDDWTYLDATENSDLHTTVSKLIWPNLNWTGDDALDRKIAEQPYYRHMKYRDLAKRGGHGSNYLLKPKTAAEHLKIPVNLAEAFQSAYYAAFPSIPKLHTWVAEQLQTKMYLTNVFGRRRDFFDRPDSDETIRKAVAYLPQSATADRLNLGLYRVWKYMPEVELIAQVHDAIYLQAPEYLDPKQLDLKIRKCLEVPLYYKGRRFVVPSEGKVGKNWGSFDKKNPEKNPYGLKKLVFN